MLKKKISTSGAVCTLVVYVGVFHFDAPVKLKHFQHVHGTFPWLGMLPIPAAISIHF